MALNDIYVSVDLGSSSIKMAVAEEDINGLKITDIDEFTSQGISRGEVINTDICYKKLNSIISQFSKKVDSIIMNISSPSILGFCTTGSTSINGKKITKEHINSAITDSEDYHNYQQQNKTIFTYPYNFKINHSAMNPHPIGVKANHLQVHYHMAYVDKKVVNNIYKVIEKTNVETENEIISAIASSNLVLTTEQKRSGVCLLDIGASVCDLIIFKDNIMKVNTIIEFGGNDVDNAISYAYDCSLEEAQKLKKNNGFININNTTYEHLIDFKQSDNSQKTLSNYQLADVIKDSHYKLLKQVKLLLKNNALEQNLGAGFIIIGDGGKIDGFINFAREILKNKVALIKIDTHYLKLKNMTISNSVKTKISKKIQQKIIISEIDFFHKYCNVLSLLCYKDDDDYLQQIVQPKLQKNNIQTKFFGFVKKKIQAIS